MECDEERYHILRGNMFSVSVSEGRTPEISQISSTITDTKVKVGAYHHRFYHNINPRLKENNALWIIIDCLMKLAHFISLKVGVVYRSSGRQVYTRNS